MMPLQLLTHPPEELLTSVESMNDTFWKTSEVGAEQSGLQGWGGSVGLQGCGCKGGAARVGRN